MVKFIGAHLSIGKGLHTLQKQMDELKSNTCACFLKNQRTFNFKPLKEDVIKKFRANIKEPEMILPHGPYLINLANDETGKMYNLFVDDLHRCEKLGIKLYNMHPGSNTINNYEESIKRIATGINKALNETKSVIVTLENMAGQGRVIGRSFEDLKAIIDLIENKERIGVTLDTCHLFGAGYDIRTEMKFEQVIRDFDKIIGIKYLKAMHLNDSKMELGSLKDRHEQIGKGKIGLDCFRFIMQSSYFENIPLILETPNPEKYAEEIALLKSFIKQ